MVEILELVSCHRHIVFSLAYGAETVNWFCPDSFENPGRFLFLAEFAGFWYTDFAALSHTGNRREVNCMECFFGFLASVAASVVSYFVCKWLDHHDKGQ